MGLDPLAGLPEWRGRPEPALAHPAHLLGLDQTGELQDADMLLDAVEGQARRPRQLAQCRRAGAQALEDASPLRIREREERGVERQCTDRFSMSMVTADGNSDGRRMIHPQPIGSARSNDVPSPATM